MRGLFTIILIISAVKAHAETQAPESPISQIYKLVQGPHSRAACQDAYETLTALNHQSPMSETDLRQLIEIVKSGECRSIAMDSHSSDWEWHTVDLRGRALALIIGHSNLLTDELVALIASHFEDSRDSRDLLVEVSKFRPLPVEVLATLDLVLKSAKTKENSSSFDHRLRSAKLALQHSHSCEKEF